VIIADPPADIEAVVKVALETGREGISAGRCADCVVEVAVEVRIEAEEVVLIVPEV
jgi:hypothetical protein